MRFLISGGSGFIGSYLMRYLAAEGHAALRLVRRTPQSGDELRWDPSAGALDPAVLDGVDVVINLSGAGLADRRWNKAYKRELIDSRIGPTALLARALAEAAIRPRLFLSWSAVGWYGHRAPDEQLDESSAPGEGFVAELAQQWEAAAAPARAAGVRVLHPRCGIVIGAGGALAKMAPAFRSGLGGKLGSGRQAFSWIALDDIGPALLHMVGADALDGPVNLTAPQPVTQAELARLLGAALHRPTAATAPAFALRAMLGEMADELLHGQRVLPRKLLESGYEFRCASLGLALERYLPRLSRTGE